MPRKRLVLEKDIEKSFVKHLKELGCKSRKLNGMGAKDWPDRLIMIPKGISIYIEFKKPGEELSPTQETWHKDVAEMGFTNVYICTSWKDAIEIVRSYIK